MAEVRDRIVSLVEEAEGLIPQEWLTDLPPGEYTSGMPEWRPFEHQVWEIGEQIRQLVATQTSLRRDVELQDAFCRIACSRNTKNGRQPFIGLLAFTACVNQAPKIANQLGDYRVTGQVINALLRMRNGDYATEIEHHKSSEKSWIRKKAETYCTRYA